MSSIEKGNLPTSEDKRLQEAQAYLRDNLSKKEFEGLRYDTRKLSLNDAKIVVDVIRMQRNKN